MSVVIFNNMFDDFLISMPLSNPVVQHYLRRAKYIDQSRAGGIPAITGSFYMTSLSCKKFKIIFTLKRGHKGQ